MSSVRWRSGRTRLPVKQFVHGRARELSSQETLVSACVPREGAELPQKG